MVKLTSLQVHYTKALGQKHKETLGNCYGFLSRLSMGPPSGVIKFHKRFVQKSIIYYSFGMCDYFSGLEIFKSGLQFLDISNIFGLFVRSI